MNGELGFKDLYEVSLKTTYPIEVSGVRFDSGETIAFFDKIQIANFQEIKEIAAARGGFDNRGFVFWENTKEMKINFTQGVFSKVQLALMTNSQLLHSNGLQGLLMDIREELETDENGTIVTRWPIEHPAFVYDKNTGKKLSFWHRNTNEIFTNLPFCPVVVDYKHTYNNVSETLVVGRELTQGFLSLTGKMRVKDDVTGKVKTGIIKIPKLRLMSDLSMRVGSDAIPQVGRLDAVAVPQGGKGQSKVMEIIFLNDDIDADM